MTVKDKELLEIHVSAYPNPISYHGHYYQRSGSMLQELKGASLDRFLRRSQGRTWDSVPVPGVEKQLVNRPSISEIEAPDGFIPITITQAILEYSKPFMEISESDDVKDQNDIFQIVQSVWNYTIALEGGNDSEDTKMKIFNSMKSIYGMDRKDANEFFEKMIERKRDLFPPEIQQKPSMTIIYLWKKHVLKDSINGLMIRA
ncbi:transcriptional regulator [Candidatus Magnetomorum sp. HK-1]|nr:transcriptional regulator [Candidatus Magnetomorum sp. HK-1]KPA09071.1 transcriptional regulator [Candidatus Magnetomorum sp. HK-1]